MTYTFKLARRLAVSRKLSMLPVLLVLFACSGDATAPEGTPAETVTSDSLRSNRDLTPVLVRINPSAITAETNQLIQFRAHGRTATGDSVAGAITWRATGGTILPDGRFSAAAIGSYTVIATNHVRGEIQQDSSTVQVVRRQTKIAAVEITPGSAALTPGLSQTFSAIGRMANGKEVLIGVVWSATGGIIDPAGSYTAGDTAGTYQVIASNTAGTLADTATVTISAPPSLPPPTNEPPPSEPVLAQVVLKPATPTLAPLTQKQFKVYGITSTGDSVAVSVQFSATGGTITSGGLYTAGTNPGTFRVIARSDALADTSTVTITATLGSGTVGIPFGPFGGWDGTAIKPNTQVFSFSVSPANATNVIDLISAARLARKKLLLALTSGKHSNYMTDGVFDMAKWKAKMDTYNTSAIKSAVAAGVSDGTIVGNIVMDEPSNTSPENTWGPAGTLNKARVDSMAVYARAILPTLPMGVTMDYRIWPDQHYRELDFIISQYRVTKGDITTYRDGALALGQRDGHQIVFSLNILDGGYKIDGCPVPQTGGPGTYGGYCRMTADQVRDFGLILGPAGCGLAMWRYDYDFIASADNQQAFKAIADRLVTLPGKSCRRA